MSSRSSAHTSFPRPFEHAMWATGGLCVSDVAPSDVSFSPLDNTGGFPPPQPLTARGHLLRRDPAHPRRSRGCDADPDAHRDAAGGRDRAADVHPARRACAGHLPDRPRSGDSGARSLHGRHPEDRGSLVQRYMGNSGVPVHKLPTINLSDTVLPVRADQRPHRSTPPRWPRRSSKLITTLPEFHQQVHLMYFNNLDAPLPERVAEFVRGPVQRVLRSRRLATT